MKFYRFTLCCLALLAAVSSTAQAKSLSNAQQVKDCDFSTQDQWWKTDFSDLPRNIAKNPTTGKHEFCEFYQFAQDYFLYLVSPSDKPDVDNWEDPDQFPLLETGGTNSCDKDRPKRALNLRTVKSPDAQSEFMLPERIDQAGAHAIYDQNGNVAFYEVRFSKNLCDFWAIQKKPNFPGKTVEMKMAWKVLEPSDNADAYYQTEATIDGHDYTLGMIGWHIVVAADNHPEFVWASLTHDAVAVSCDDIGADESAHAFTSKACAQNKSQCQKLNQSLKSHSLKLPEGKTPNDVCQVFDYGTAEGQPIDTRDGLNVALIKKLNQALKQQIFGAQDTPESLKVWKNYRMLGALWVSDTDENSHSLSNQRGSLKLANPVMETTFQQNEKAPGGTGNCFFCHSYQGKNTGKSNTTYTADLSHSFDDIIDGQCQDVQTKARVNSQPQAEQICPQTCPSDLKWNGQWTNQDADTHKELPQTVCGCCIP